MAQDRLVQNADGSVTLIYASGARQTVPASNKAGLLQLAERVPAEQIEKPVLETVRQIAPESVPKTTAELKNERFTNLKQELQSQYNNLVQADARLAYGGRQSDLDKIFNAQADYLANYGVETLSDIRPDQNTPFIYNTRTGQKIADFSIDRDTGAQKWGDIFSGVEGGANWGVQFSPEGLPIMFPVHEKGKSLYQQVVGSDLFKVASLALAAYGVYNLATAGAAGGASAGSAATSGAASGGGSAISGAGLTSAEMAALKGAAAYGEGATAAQIAAGAAGAGSIYALPSGSLIPGSIPYSELTVIPPATAGMPATVAGLEAPGLSAMGGGTGLLAPVSGGVVSEMGFVPVGATPALGDPSSFINDPSLLYGETPGAVISEDYLATNIADGGSMSMADALKALQYGSSLGGLLGGPQQQGLIGGGGGVAGRAPGGVDYSELLKSLTRQASVPGVAPLIGPVVQPQESLLGMQVQPVQYQPLNRSLLG